jgi:hypothetical protein
LSWNPPYSKWCSANPYGVSGAWLNTSETRVALVRLPNPLKTQGQKK